MFVRKSGIIVPKTYENIDVIKADLTRNVSNWDETIRTVKFYEEFDEYILIPRYYKFQEKIDIIDQTNEGEVIDIEDKIQFRNSRQEKVFNEFKNRTNGIIQLEPGTGKTVLAIKLISHFKRKTIIFAHKDKLLEQWKNEFLEFTNLKEDDISRLTTNNYKEALKKKIILSTPHIILQAYNNQKKEFFDELQKSNIGILFIDECHVGIGPEQFSKSSIFVNARRTFGLSATPYRSDGASDMLELHLGPVIYFEPEEGELLEPKIIMYYFPFNVYRNNNYFMYGGKFQLSRYYTQLYKSEVYLRETSKVIRKGYEKGRKILVLGKNILPLLKIAERCNLPKEDVGIFIPGAISNKKYKKLLSKLTDTFDLMEAFYTKRVVFSTFGACRDGNNRKDLDMLVLSCPTTNVEQAVGRVLRKLDDKKQPVVVDLVDTNGGPLVYSKVCKKKVPWFIRSAANRYQFYKQKKWNVSILTNTTKETN